MQLHSLLCESKMTPAELATAIFADRTTVWRWMNKGFRPRAVYTDALLALFSKRLGRPVSYEEAFGKGIRRARRKDRV